MAAAVGLLLVGLGAFPQEPLRRLAEARLQTAIGEGSRLGALRVTPFLLKAELLDLRLEGPGYSLEVPEGRVDLAPRALTGALAVRRLELESPVLEVALDGEGETPVERPDVFPPLEVEAVAIRGASLRWTGPGPRELSLEGVSAEGAIGSGRLTLEALRGVWRGESTFELGPATARMTVTRELDVVLDASEARLGASTLRARGPLARRGEMDLELDLEGDLDLTDAGSMFDQPEVGGALRVRGHLRGPTDPLAASLEAEGAASWGPWSSDDLRVHLEADATGVEARLEGSLLGGRFEGEARLAGDETSGALRLRDMDLARLPVEMRPPVRIVGARVDLGWEGTLDGPLRVELAVRGQGRHEAATARLEARARGTVLPEERVADLSWTAAMTGATLPPEVVEWTLDAHGRTRGSWPPEVTGEISGVVNAPNHLPEDRVALAGSFRTHGADLSARLHATEPLPLALELELQGEEIRSLSATAEHVDLSRLGSEVSGFATVRLEASGPLRSPGFAADVSAAALEWGGAHMGPLEIAADGTTRHARFRAALPALSIDAEGEIEASEEGPRLWGRAALHETSLTTLGGLVGLEEPPGGELTATLAFDLPLERWTEAEATLDVHALEVRHRDHDWRAEPFRGELSDGRLSVRDVRVGGTGVSLDLDASAGLDEDAPVELRAWVEAELGAFPLPEGWFLDGSLSGALGLTGTRARPAFEGALHAGDVVVRGPSAPEFTIDDMEIHLGDRTLSLPRFEVRLGPAGKATLEGEIPYAAVWPDLREGGLAPTDRLRLSAAWEGVALEPLEGGVAGELALGGGLGSLEELAGEVRFSAPRLAFEGLSLEVPPARLVLEGGRLTVDELKIRSAPGDLVVTGAADLLDDRLDLRARGGFALGFLSALVPGASIGGDAEVDLALAGPLSSPAPRGSVSLDGVSLRMRALPQAVTGIRGRVDVEGETATLNAQGALGGGTLQLEGEALAAGDGLGDLWLQLTGRNVALRSPPGLRSRLDVDLTLAGRPGDLILAGDVGVLGGVYEVDAAVREALRAPAPAAAAASDALRDVALDVTVELRRPLAVHSAFGRLEATGRITARGDLQEPTPFGRLDVPPGGRIELQGRELTITGGAIAYSGSWDAALSLNGETIVPDVEFNDRSRRDVRVRASLAGSIRQPSLGLSSEPRLSRQEIVSAIATGRLQSSLVDSSAWLLGGQAATVVSGQLTRRVAQTFGLDEIIVRPDLVARETDPSARFTFGKRIGRPLALVYSAGLGGPETRFAEMRAFPGFNVQLRAQRRDTGTHELGFGQRFEFGGGAPNEPIVDDGVRLEEVRFEGAPLDDALRRSVRLSTGKRVADWRLQQEADRLRSRLRRAGHFDAEVSARFEGSAAVFTVEPGPAYRWRVEGMADPPSLERAMAPALFEADAVDLGHERLLEVLAQRGHVQAVVEASTRDEGDRREILFTATTGPRYDPIAVRFPGARALAYPVLLEAAGGASGLLVTPEEAVAGLEEAYRARHFLAARVGLPQVERQGSALTLTVPIDEGPSATLLWVRAEGATLPAGELVEALTLPPGTAFTAETVSDAVARARDLYLSLGFTDVRIRPELVVEGHDVGLLLRIREGQRRAIESVTLAGNSRTRDWLIQRALELEEGDPLDPRRLGEAERRLLELGTFSRSAIVPDPEKPGALTVDLREAASFTAAYDLRWEDETGWSGLVDGLSRNLFGLGVGLGGRVRYGSDLRELRGSLHFPAALTTGDVTGSVFRTEEDIPADDFEIVRRQTGFQVQQSLGRVSRLEVLVGYRFRRNLTIAPTLPEIPIDIGGLDVSFLRTTQDDLLDPRRGAFWSLNLNIAPSWLGSDAPLVTSYAQTAFTQSFAEDRFTWAHSYRLGLAWGLDGEPVIASERFRAGGASSLRGFGTNEVGPRGFIGEPTGGEAVVIMNQELRYHHPSGFGLVGFYDVGNVFPTVDSMRFDLRHTLGTGLRWASPVGLLRLDVGFPLDRQPEEKSYRFFFGLGQAF